MGRKAKRGRELRRMKGSVRDGKRPDDGEEDYATAAGNGLPMANLVRLMRQVIPTDVKISTRAKQLTQDCAVGFVGGGASECAMAQHRCTIAPEDFHAVVPEARVRRLEPMSTYIRRYREDQNAGRPPTTAVAGASSFTDEEVQFLMSLVPQQHGEYDGAASS